MSTTFEAQFKKRFDKDIKPILRCGELLFDGSRPNIMLFNLLPGNYTTYVALSYTELATKSRSQQNDYIRQRVEEALEEILDVLAEIEGNLV